ncbi:shikimate kinase [Spongiivirga citrea]|uniref:Shikimate kinase n=2 Tax=Spongiivirga citrea TaxID=1481457 RepID=A0A6M0CG10_9FLAO|nr:shikimate kinase [Spongiivirga citrea]
MQGKKIVLLGYMGSGKSTIGKLLANKLKYQFIDLDQYIEKQEGHTIPNIFKNEGELYFRKKEHHYLKEVLALKQDVILSLGGGTPCFAGNMDVVKKGGASSIYLKLSIPTIVKRLAPEKAGRPLIAHIEKEEDLLEFIGKHLFERSYYYNQAEHVVSVDQETHEQIIDSIQTMLD